MARFDVIYGFLTELVRDELGFLPRPLTYLLFPADQSSLLKCLASLSLTRSMGFSWPLAGFLLPQPKQKSTSEKPHLWFLFPLSAVGYPGNESVASTCPPQSPSRNSFCLHYQTVGLQSPWVEKAYWTEMARDRGSLSWWAFCRDQLVQKQSWGSAGDMKAVVTVHVW